MKISTGKMDPVTKMVSVTFDHAGVTHARDVRAVHDAKGAYDDAATMEQIEAIGRGVERKIDMGALINPVAHPIPETTEE